MLGPPRPGPFGASAEVRMTSGRASGAKLLARLPPRARLPPDAGAGTELRRLGRRCAAPGPPKADGFDLAAYLRRRGVAGELQARAPRPPGASRGGAAGLVDAARRRGERSIAAGLDRGSAALARGMVLGQDELIDPATRDDFRASGLAHLLAVSGQNVMLLAALALPLLAAAGLPPRGADGGHRGADRHLRAAGRRRAVAAARRGDGRGVAGGARGRASGVALVRAAAGGVRHAGAQPARDRAIPGWQLSFAAVAGILVLAPPVRDALAALPRPLAEGVAITLAATVATAPLLAHHFGTLSLAGLPANVLALPVVAPIMWLGHAARGGRPGARPGAGQRRARPAAGADAARSGGARRGLRADARCPGRLSRSAREPRSPRPTRCSRRWRGSRTRASPARTRAGTRSRAPGGA